MYKPTTANILGSNSGSLECFQYRKRWGWMDSADKTDCTTMVLTAKCLASARTLQWGPTDSGGVLHAVAAMRWRMTASYFLFRPRPGASTNPSMRSTANRRRHLTSVITSKAAIYDHLKTGHIVRSKTWLFYRIFARDCKSSCSIPIMDWPSCDSVRPLLWGRAQCDDPGPRRRGWLRRIGCAEPLGKSGWYPT